MKHWLIQRHLLPGKNQESFFEFFIEVTVAAEEAEEEEQSFFVSVSAAISSKKGKFVCTAIWISLAECFIFVLMSILYFPIPTYLIFHNFTIFWVSKLTALSPFLFCASMQWISQKSWLG